MVSHQPPFSPSQTVTTGLVVSHSKHKPLEQHLYNGSQRCTNVILMFCVCWALTLFITQSATDDEGLNNMCTGQYTNNMMRCMKCMICMIIGSIHRDPTLHTTKYIVISEGYQ